MSSRRFRAFVSYCHADRAFAATLQRRLETYRLPRRLSDRVTPLPGEARGRIGPVFRDRADLSAAGDLSAAVREAIAASSALVVVASPDAVVSIWVAREIALFRELHPGGLILVAQARGAPGAATPPALIEPGTEPLAADFRPEGDGRRLAFLKIVAGLAELPLDALVQRDAQRQVRRVTAVTLGAVVLVVVMAGLLVMALQARREAEHRRADAEGIVEFMQTTLRDGLRTTGNLSVMGVTNARALRYFDDQGNPESLSDENILRRALILQAMGEDDANSGSLPTAIARFNEAYRWTSAVLSRRPADPDALYAHAQSEFWLGYIAWKQDDRERVRARWGAYLADAYALARAAPRTVRSLMELGYSHGDLCELNMRGQSDVAAAVDHCRKAIAFERGALQLVPGTGPENSKIQMALANRIGWYADVLATTGDLRGARSQREAEAAIYATLRGREPDSVELRDRVTWPQIGLGKIDIAEGQVGAGLARLNLALRDLDRLSELFPDNEWYVGERIRVNVLIAKARRDAGFGDWRAYRNKAAALLGLAPDGRASPGLERFRPMLKRLDQERK